MAGERRLKPTSGMTAQRHQNMQQLHYRLGSINWTLHADIEKPKTLEKKNLIIYTK